MAHGSTFASSLSVGGVTQIPQACNARRQAVINCSARVGIVSPSSAQLRATFMPSTRTAKSSAPSFQVVCKRVASEAVVETEHDLTAEEMSPLVPSTLQVQSLLLEVCDGTSIAELKLKVGAFQLHMKRDVGNVNAAASAPVPAPLPPVSTPPTVASAPAASTPSVASSLATPPKSNNHNHASSILPATVSKTASLFGLLEAAADQGLSFVTSPKVGVFRRGRNVKVKTGKPLVEEGVTIKAGQVVGYLEQLGTQQPVEARVSGEVVQVLWEDGESVGYGDPLISIRPSFPGIVARGALN